MKTIRLLAFVAALAAPALAPAAPFAYVTNFSSASVAVTDLATNTVAATVPLGCGSPYGIAVNSTGTRVYTNCRTDGSTRVIDTSTNTVIATIPSSCTVSSDVAVDSANSRVYVACGGPDTVLVIDATTNTVLTSVPVGLDPTGLAIHPASSRLYVTLTATANAVAVIDTTTNTVVTTVPVGVNPVYVAVNPAGTRVYASNSSSRNVSVIDTATNTVIATYALTQPPPPPSSQVHDALGITVSPDGSRLYVSHRLALTQIIDVLDAATGAILTTIPVAQGPRGIGFSADGTRLLVVNQTAEKLQVLDAATHAILATLPMGFQPLNVAMAPSTPSTVTIDQAAPQVDPTNAATINFTVVFDEAVTGFTGTDVSFAGSTAPGTLVANVTGGPATYNVAVTGMTGAGTVVASVPAGRTSDAVGSPNLASTSTDNAVTFDNVAPTVTIDQAIAQTDPTSAAPILFTATFSEPITGFTGTDVSFAGSTVGGTLVANVTGSGATYTVSVTGMVGSGTVVASIPAGMASDLAGNANVASTSVDNTVTFGAAPSVTINQAAGQADPTNVAPVLFTVTFSEPVTGFTAADVSLSTGTLGGSALASVSGSGAVYTVSVAGMAGQGTLTLSIPAGAATNGSFTSLASTSTDNSVTFDALAPAGVVQPLPLQPNPATTSPILFAVNFTEPVIGFTSSDVGFTGSTVAGTLVASVSGSGATYTVSVSGMTSNGFVLLSVPAGVATDLAGNLNLAAAVVGGVTYTGAGAVVTTFTAPSATGSGNITAQFTGGGPTCSFSGPQYIGSPPGAPPIPPVAPPGSIGFPHGLFSFTTINCTPGAALAFTVTYPSALPAGTQYWKYGPEPGNATPHWYVLPATITGNVATFTITDGAQGDDDLTANGTIVDQGGPGFPVSSGAQQTPTLSEWALALMALLMVVFAAKGRRRRATA